VLSARAALGNSCGLVLLGLSLVLAAGSVALPATAVWSGRATWLVACGVAAYLISIGVVAWTSAQLDASELREVRRVRDRLAGLLRSERPRGHAAAALVRTIEETVAQLDKDIVPALEQLTARHDSVAASLAKYANGALPAPDADVLERVRDVEERQRAAITDCVRHVVNADAALLAIVNDNRDSGTVAEDARAWTARLLDLHDALQEMLGLES
jgi:hypothetical protein